MVICLRMEKTYTAKTPPGDFKVTTPEIHYYQNKRVQVKESQYLIPIYSWTLTPIPNWTCSVVAISHFQCTAPNTWLTNYTNPSTRLDHQLEKDVGYKVLQFINTMKITKLLGYKTLRRTNAVASSSERWTRANLSPVTICLNKTFASSFINLHTLWRPLK